MLDKYLRAEEGERLSPYLCEAKVPTIGVGATTYLDGRKVKLSDPPITREQMDRMLAVEIDRYINEVTEIAGGDVTTNQLVALVMLAYNIGFAGLRASTVIKAHKAGNYAAAGRAFSLWNKYRPEGPGTPLVEHPVLVARRLREAAIYLTPDDMSEAHRKAPQAVEAESKLTKSPIAQAGALIVGAPVVELATQASDGVSALKPAITAVKGLIVETLGIPPQWVVPALLIVAGLVVLRWRLKQRELGYA